jgi:hypothetical protein
VTDIDELFAPLRQATLGQPPSVDDVARRAARLRRRRRMARAALFATLVIAAAIPIVALRSSHSSRIRTVNPPSTTTKSTTAPTSTTSDTLPPLHALKGTRPFVPPTRQQGGNTVLPVTFLDGTSIQLVHPRTVDLAHLGLAWQAEAVLPGSVPKGVLLRILHGAPAEIFPNRTPDKTFPNGAQEYDESAGGYLAVPIGSWTVIATTESTSNDERATFAMAIAGHVNSNGYLVLTPHPPVMLAPADGPNIQFGNGIVGLLRRPCDPLSGRHTSAGLAIESATDNHLGGTWLCDQGRNLVIYLTGQAEPIAEQLQVR